MASNQPTTNARAQLRLTDTNGNQMQLIQETGNCQLNALSKFTINVPNFAITDGTDTIDNFLATRIADISTSTTADASLTTRLSTEETARTSAVSAETTSRVAGDTSLTTVLANETSTRTTADASLTTRVGVEETARAAGDTSLTTVLANETSTRTAADASLTTRVGVEETARTSAVSNETTSRIAGDTSLATVLSNETSTRIAADASLTTRVGVEETARTSAVSNETTSRIAGDNSLTTVLSNETSTRTTADASLTTRAGDEETARASADTSLSTRLTAVESSLVAGVDWKAPVANIGALIALEGDASNGDVRIVLDQLDAFLFVGTGGEDLTALNQNLGTKYIRFIDSTEIATNTASIDTRISTEEVARSTTVSAETTSRVAGDTSLTTRLASEETDRTSADASLTTRVGVEETARTSADTSLTTRVAAEEATRSSAVSSALSAITSLALIVNTTFATEFNTKLAILDASIQNINAYLISIGGEYSNVADTTERMIFIGTNHQYYAVSPSVTSSDWPNVQGLSAVNPDDEIWNFSYNNNEWVIQNTVETTIDGRLYKDISNNSAGTTLLFELVTSGTSKTNLSTSDFPFTDNKIYIDYNEDIGGHRIYQIYLKYNSVNHYLFVQQNDYSYNHASSYGYLTLIAENEITPAMKKATQFKINTNVAVTP